jgi:predicted outer membrane repeat protein
VIGSRFLGNSATGTGGAIHSFDTLTVTGSTFSGNSAIVDSDNISSGDQGVTKVTNSTIVCNSLACLGSGGAFVDNASGTLVQGNTTVASGAN